MGPGATPTRARCWGKTLSLAAAAALVAALPARAEPPDVLVTGPPAMMASLLVADGYDPSQAGWKALGTLFAGADSRERVWDLEGVFSKPVGRRPVGAASMFLGGFNGSPLGGGFAATQLELALALAGEQRDCWVLIDTDMVRPVPEGLLDPQWNGQPFNVGNKESRTLEQTAYGTLVGMAYYTSQKAFDAAADKSIQYINLDRDPGEYQGKIVFVQGRLRGLRRWSAPMRASVEGVNDLYEGYVQSDTGHMYCCIFSVLRPGLEVKEKLDVPVTFAGYFFKKWRYQNQAGDKAKERFAPLVIGHALDPHRPKPEPRVADSGMDVLLPVFVGIVAVSVGLLVGLAYWFRRTDERHRKRLLRTLEQDRFVPPAPEAVPMAQPVAAPRSSGTENGSQGLPGGSAASELPPGETGKS